MQDNNNSKDYESYFAELEKRINGEKSNTNSDASPKPIQSVKERAKHRKRKFEFLTAYAKQIFFILLCLVLIIGIILSVKSCRFGDNKNADASKSVSVKNTKEKKTEVLFAEFTENSLEADASIKSKAVIFINSTKNTVVASRNAKEKLYPASTTKIMTLLVAVENITDYNDTFTMTYQITDPLYKQGATVAGFLSGEVINMNDLIYGTVLPSGGDAAMGLAQKISGSEEAFVKLMNAKAGELGLKNTHFTNCTGLFDKNHYTTAEDLAVILRAAMKNEVCKKVLSTYKYTTSATDKHPQGLSLENTIFKYMYGTEPDGSTILGGKTGFVNESGYCIASFGENDNGESFICITLQGESRWPAVYDQINLYTMYAKGETK